MYPRSPSCQHTRSSVEAATFCSWNPYKYHYTFSRFCETIAPLWAARPQDTDDIWQRVALVRHQSFRMALRQTVTKSLILFESNCQAWEPNRWKHCADNSWRHISVYVFEVRNGIIRAPKKKFSFLEIYPLSVRSYVTMLPRCLALLVYFNDTLFIYSGGG